MRDSGIEWTDHTWNFVVGCTQVSRGCDHCYALELHNRRYRKFLAGDARVPAQFRVPFEQVQLLPHRLADPKRWGTPALVFVNSLADVFHRDVPDELLVQAWAVMATTPRHTFQVLTKRPMRMQAVLSSPEFEYAVLSQVEFDRAGQRGFGSALAGGADFDWRWPLPNVWMGVSVEDQDVMWRAQQLLDTPAAVRFLSCEPLLGPLDFLVNETRGMLMGRRDLLGGSWWPILRDHHQARYFHEEGLPALDWIIVGGESGFGVARPLDGNWVRAIRDECAVAGVPFFFKQWGGETSKSGGRELDGETYSQMPVAFTRGVSRDS